MITKMSQVSCAECGVRNDLFWAEEDDDNLPAKRFIILCDQCIDYLNILKNEVCIDSPICEQKFILYK